MLIFFSTYGMYVCKHRRDKYSTQKNIYIDNLMNKNKTYLFK